ncbi:hypothetical protein GCM10010390_57090 [Streptomyces mordarskii]
MVWAGTIDGMIGPSAIRGPSTPRTRSRGSTTVEPQRAAGAAEAAVTALGVLDGAEDLQRRRGVPAGAAVGGPCVEGAEMAADIGHRVDAAGAAEHLAARGGLRMPGQPRLRDGGVAPVVLTADEGEPRGGVVDLLGRVVLPGLSSSTRVSGISGNRAATTAPAEPAPTTM